MIVTPIFTVLGVVTIDEDVLFCQSLTFLGADSKLVIVPKKNAAPGAQRMLKIVANTVDTTLCSNAKITYNLDGDITNPGPIGPSGLDPETTPPKAKEGSSYIQDPLDVRCFINPADILSPQDLLDRIKPECKWGDKSYNNSLDPSTNYPNPNLFTLDAPGEYPRAADGGNGLPGGPGTNGNKGQDGPILEIWVERIAGPGLIIDLRGQQGGEGGDGGTGQHGGNGQKGSTSVSEYGETWAGIPEPYSVCKQQPGRGGDGGKGGNAGIPGRGGDGGTGGTLKVLYTATALPGLPTWTVLTHGGLGGAMGKPGLPGEGGQGGPPGDNQLIPGTNVSPCLPSIGGDDGDTGDPYHPKDNDGKGKDGGDGLFITDQVPAIPKINFTPWG